MKNLLYGVSSRRRDGENYFGDSSDGDVTISSDTNLTVLNKDGSYDGDMVLKQYETLTVDATKTLTVDQPCRGLFIYVSGNCIINGAISMTAKGGFSDPTTGKGGGDSPSDDSSVSANGLRLPMFKKGETDTLASADFAGCGNSVIGAVGSQFGIAGNGKIFSIAKVGGAGGVGNPDAGDAGVTNQSGGGGSGKHGGGGSGNGAAGTCFAGGGGGGAGNGGGGVGDAAVAYGGAGGAGHHDAGDGAGGGAGNPGGAGSGTGGAGTNGCGGLLILVVGGDLTFGADAVLQADGSAGGGGGPDDVTGAGGSGGGALLVLYAGSLTDSGVDARADGGAGGDGVDAFDGGAGGNGVVQGPTQVD